MDTNGVKFSYAISDQEIHTFSRFIKFESLKCIISYTKETEVIVAKTENKELAVIGFCIDSHIEFDRYDIPQALLAVEGNVNNVYNFCNRFAGKYVVLYYDGKEGFLWGDATASLQIIYCNRKDYPICVAFTEKIIADKLNVRVSDYSKRIRSGSGISQPMPWNMTMYDEINALLPNHYLCISERKPIRVTLNIKPISESNNPLLIAEQSNKTIKNIVQEYSKYYELVCPLTSGYDSRVVFSFLRIENPKIHCYTFNHKSFNEKTDDLVVPSKICNYYEQPYTVINDISASESVVTHVQALAGDYIDKATIDLACTYNSVFMNKALVNGDIIDQVGKSLLGNTIPTVFATPAYMQCKVHNVEKKTKSELRKQLQEIKLSENKDLIFDLFAMENRCGRWAAQISTIYSICGITSLNIFNCKELILQWISIPRRMRRDKWIHEKMLVMNDEHLLSFPFNPSSKLDIIQNNWVLFYLASFIKQLLLKLKIITIG